MAETIAILVINRNYGQFMQNTLESIWRQSYSDLSIIICDDASNDNSWEIICASAQRRGYRYARTEIHRVSTNRGKNAWINSIIPNLPEENIVILDSDDTIPETYIEILYSELKSSPSLDFVYTDCNLIDTAGVKIGVGRSRSFDAALVENHSYIPEPALTRTEALRRALPLNVDLLRGTKHEKYKRIVRLGGRGKHTESTRFNYRMHSSNIFWDWLAHTFRDRLRRRHV